MYCIGLPLFVCCCAGFVSLSHFFSFRKKVLDFYQRACLSGYCSAFAYKPMQVSMSSQLNGKCVELAKSPGLFSGVELPCTTPIKHNTCRNSWSSDGTSLEHCWAPMSLFIKLLKSFFFLFFFTLLLLQRVLVRGLTAKTVSKRSAGKFLWAWCHPSSRPDWTQCG